MKNSSSSSNINSTTVSAGGAILGQSSSGFSLIHKKSDICEWTDSMADVSLTGMLTDLQSPVKQANSMYNENSNNSIFISVFTLFLYDFLLL